MKSPSELAKENSPESQLKKAILDKKVVVVVGTGVSIAATRNHATASWEGLLLNALEFIENLKEKREEQLIQSYKTQIELGDIGDLLAVAQVIEGKLGAPNGKWVMWLSSVFGSNNFPVKNESLVKKILALGCPIITTNYDGIFEAISNKRTILWNESSEHLRGFYTGARDGILHLHGYWDNPESVVLGRYDYSAVTANKPLKAFLEATGYDKTLLFIGCGEGLVDPHFNDFFKWRKQTLTGTTHSLYILVPEKEREKTQEKHAGGDLVDVLTYGEFSAFENYLDSLLIYHESSIDLRSKENSSGIPYGKSIAGKNGDYPQVHITALWNEICHQMVELLTYDKVVLDLVINALSKSYPDDEFESPEMIMEFLLQHEVFDILTSLYRGILKGFPVPPIKNVDPLPHYLVLSTFISGLLILDVDETWIQNNRDNYISGSYLTLPVEVPMTPSIDPFEQEMLDLFRLMKSALDQVILSLENYYRKNESIGAENKPQPVVLGSILTKGTSSDEVKLRFYEEVIKSYYKNPKKLKSNDVKVMFAQLEGILEGLAAEEENLDVFFTGDQQMLESLLIVIETIPKGLNIVLRSGDDSSIVNKPIRSAKLAHSFFEALHS